MWCVTEDLPGDVRSVLTQLFAEGQEALAEGDPETARETVSSAEEVATNKLPEGDLRGQVLHGCGRVRRLLDADVVAGDESSDDTDGRVEADAAVEYLAAMERLL